MKSLPLMAAAGAVLVSMAAGASAGAAEITVFRGGDAMVVNTSAPQKGPHVLRGGMARTTRDIAPAKARRTVIQTRVVSSSGNTFWYLTEKGLVGCWLRGTGHVGRLRIVCARR